MNWNAILAIATAVIQALSENCPQESRESQRLQIRQPEPRFRRRFEVRLKRELTNPWTGCMSLREFRENQEEILAKCYSEAEALTDAEVEQLIA